MTFLLDTNVISESMKPIPDASVLAWLSVVDEAWLFLSTVTIAEVRQGIDRMPAGRNRQRLEQWLDVDLVGRFGDRLLPIDVDVALEWGHIKAKGLSDGFDVPVMDAFIAATARVHRLTLVTRNVSDFAATGVSLLNPWTEVS